MLLKDYMNYWYFTYKYPKQSKSTSSIVSKMISNHICSSTLGNMEMTDIRTKDIQSFLTLLMISGNKNKLKSINTFKKPLSAWTLRKIRQWLISAFKLAISENIILKNYAQETEPFNIPYKESSMFSQEQQNIFLEKTKKHRFHLAYVLLFITGCRRSEILGLSWDKINFKDNCIFINQTLIMEKNIPVLKTRTKTLRSVRIIPLPKKIMKMLAEYKKNQIKESRDVENYCNPYNLVFVNKDGSFHSPKNFSRNFKESLKRYGLSSDLHVHSTRHTWETNMIHNKIAITDVQTLGGWSTPNVLLNIYSHTLQETQISAINYLYEKNMRNIL